MSLSNCIYENLDPGDFESFLALAMKETQSITAVEKIGSSTWKIRIINTDLNANYVVFADLMNEPEDGAGITLSFLSGSEGVYYELINQWNSTYHFTKAYVRDVHGTGFLILESDLMTCLGVTQETLKGFFYFFCESWVPMFISFLRSS